MTKTKDKITVAALIEAGFTDETEQNQVLALCAFLDCVPDDLAKMKYEHYGALSVYSQGSREYAIGTDSEADKAAHNYIEDSAWAFNASFLSNFTGLPEEMFKAVQDKCEGCNDAVLQCIKQAGGLDSFVEEAISADGRGHFMSSYDGEENDIEIGEGDTAIRFYIYRIN